MGTAAGTRTDDWWRHSASLAGRRQ